MLALILLTFVTAGFTYATYVFWDCLVSAATDHTENASALEVAAAFIMTILIGGCTIIFSLCLLHLIFTLI